MYSIRHKQSYTEYRDKILNSSLTDGVKLAVLSEMCNDIEFEYELETKRLRQLIGEDDLIINVTISRAEAVKLGLDQRNKTHEKRWQEKYAKLEDKFKKLEQSIADEDDDGF